MSVTSDFYFDGGLSLGNIEVAVVHGSTQNKFVYGPGTSNEAEWLGLLTAVQTALDLHIDDPIFIGDSKLVIEQANDNWQIKAIHLLTYKQALVTLTPKFKSVKFKWVPRKLNLAGIFLEKQK